MHKDAWILKRMKKAEGHYHVPSLSWGLYLHHTEDVSFN